MAALGIRTVYGLAVEAFFSLLFATLQAPQAPAAHSEAEKRILDDLAVLETFGDVQDAMNAYKERHRQSPLRELYVLHTDRRELDITNLHWRGFPMAS